MIFSFFPYLLSLERLAPLILRLTLGVIFVLWGYRKLGQRTNNKIMIIGIIESVTGIFLIIGYLTQISALLLIIILGFKLFKKIQQKAFLTAGINYYLILFVISLSLLLTGPGFLAFDLPL